MTDIDIPYGILTRVNAIAREFPAIVFDAFDPHRAAIEAAALAAGIAAIASTTVQPRSMKGSINPPGDARDVAVLASVLHQIGHGQVATAALCPQDMVHARAMVQELDLRGWRLARTPTLGARAQARR